MDECIKFVKVRAHKESVPSEAGVTITIYTWPRPPQGAFKRELAQSPNALEALWWMCETAPAAPTGSFYSSPDVEVLSYQEAKTLGETWAQGFRMPL